MNCSIFKILNIPYNAICNTMHSTEEGQRLIPVLARPETDGKMLRHQYSRAVDSRAWLERERATVVTRREEGRDGSGL